MSHATIIAAPNDLRSLPMFLRQVKAQRYFSPENAKSATALGAIQLATGALAIVCQVTATVTLPEEGVNFIGGGIWCGAMFLIVGILGVRAGKTNKKNLIVSFLVLNIITSVIFTWTLFGLAVSSLISRKTGPTVNPGTRLVSLSMTSLLLVLSFLEFIVAIISAAYCCRALHCCCSEESSVFVVVHGNSALTNAFANFPSVQNIAEQQGSSLMVTGQIGHSTRVPSAQIHVPHIQESPWSNTACSADNIREHYSTATPPTSEEAMYCEISPYDYIYTS